MRHRPPGERRATIRSTRSRVSSSIGTIRSVSSLPSGTFSQAAVPGISCTQSSSRSSSSPMRSPQGALQQQRVGGGQRVAGMPGQRRGEPAVGVDGQVAGQRRGESGCRRAKTSLRGGASGQPHSVMSVRNPATASTRRAGRMRR